MNPAGKTPLTAAVEQAAEVLDYQKKPGLIVVLTDGEETCGGAPCELGKMLHANAVQLTVHVIGFRMKDFSWTGEQSIIDVKCLAEQNGGLYINADAEQDLIEALEKTLGCPMLSQRTDTRSVQQICSSELRRTPSRRGASSRRCQQAAPAARSARAAWASLPGCRSASCRAHIRKADRAI